MSLDPSRIQRDIDDLSPELRDIAARIHANPELRFEEHKAAAWVAEAVEKHGIQVERGLAGMPTSLRARIGQGKGPHLAILAEYDALPEIGHACGHNLIAAGALGAFLALARQKDAVAGTIDLVGTPAEEGGGGKIRLLEAGAFDGVDAAMMFHPFDRDLLAHDTLASTWLELQFHGKPSHAALAPWDGNSALTACLDTFRLIDGQRVHFRDGVRVHGFIKNGGQAVNIIPELAVAEFSVRALDTEELARVRAIVERCARGAAMASGVELTLVDQGGYKNMVNNRKMARRFGEHLRALGRSPVEMDPLVGTGSTDMGDVSHALPAIHPWIAICGKGETTCHQHAFAARAASPAGQDSMLIAAKAMAMTCADLLLDPDLRKGVREEFAQRKAGASAA
ncbi:amidohydrolase [Sorangium sp. So ce388]|uniref:amidohydrolase n=1 Tax=Sorangium sp. So ce388 TaxID=3133309 RepID=UPI003F5C071F